MRWVSVKCLHEKSLVSIFILRTQLKLLNESQKRMYAPKPRVIAAAARALVMWQAKCASNQRHSGFGSRDVYGATRTLLCNERARCGVTQPRGR
ncbi:hypothetical protein EVAR_63675_1 [Eumeta japonica]|uniref:Uncharacterized protein n=1 Tax=Eumeta variegata TaxID=151549 RepID=A0A4C1ZRE6_EUMVA|nr:hypothetical protein EVAR_63675_1 [Eumeta japonica]